MAGTPRYIVKYIVENTIGSRLNAQARTSVRAEHATGAEIDANAKSSRRDDTPLRGSALTNSADLRLRAVRTWPNCVSPTLLAAADPCKKQYSGELPIRSITNVDEMATHDVIVRSVEQIMEAKPKMRRRDRNVTANSGKTNATRWSEPSTTKFINSTA